MIDGVAVVERQHVAGTLELDPGSSRARQIRRLKVFTIPADTRREVSPSAAGGSVPVDFPRDAPVVRQPQLAPRLVE